MYNHILNQDGPGTCWNSDKKTLIMGQHLITPDNLFSTEQYHLYVKCGYAKAFITQASDLSNWASIYDKMQLKRVGFSKREKFNELLLSIQNKGFDHRYPIPISNNHKILDGSHRTAASFVLKVNPSVEIFSNNTHSYDRTWFEFVGFTKLELAMIDSIKTEIEIMSLNMDELIVGVVWGCALDYWNEIFFILNNGHLATAFCVDLENQKKKMAFVIFSYQGDGMPYDRIISKSIRLARSSTKIGIFALKGLSSDEICSIKLNIREQISCKMSNYFFDNIVHILDCRQVSKLILSKYGSSIVKSSLQLI